jgi:hypothetical protein
MPPSQAARERPGAPTLRSATPNEADGSVTVAFEPPANTGTGPIIQYRLRCREMTGDIPVVVGAATPLAVAGGVLPRGRDLTFVVVAINRAGAGPPSAPSRPVRLGGSVLVLTYGSLQASAWITAWCDAATTAPGAPTLLAVTPDDTAGSVTVAFEPPSSSGGLPITQYLARCHEITGAEAEVVGATSPLAFAEGMLPRGRDLTFVVVAVNRAGEGPASAPSPPVRLGGSVFVLTIGSVASIRSVQANCLELLSVAWCSHHGPRSPHPAGRHARPHDRLRHRGLRTPFFKWGLARHGVPRPLP